MTALDHESLLESLIAVASNAGAAIVRYTQDLPADSTTQTKSSPGDLVTNLDRSLESQISHELLALLPDSQIIGEESGRKGSSPTGWVVDPIDGSTNVVHGLRHAAVCIALAEDFVPLLGVVHNPFLGETYSAIRGSGAFVTNEDSPRSRRRLSVSRVGSLASALLSFGMPYDRNKSERILAAASRAFSSCQDLRRRGSASLDIVGVALGELEGHFEVDLRIWDVAAAGLILEEAGGKITDWRGAPVSWRSAHDKIAITASNGRIHGALLSVLDTP